MARPRVRKTILGFRVLLMLSLIAAVAVVVSLYWFGRAGVNRPRPAANDAPAFEEGTRMIGKDFDYTFSQGEKSVFRVRGNSVRVAKDDTVYLDSVALTLFDKEGRRFDAESDQAAINRTTNEGRLWGDVSITGPSQLEIHSAQLLIQEKGNLLTTPGVTRVLYAGKYFGRCDALQVWLPDEVYSMLGKVRIETFPEIVPHLELDADKAIYERKQRHLRVETEAELQRGTATLDADRISGTLSEDEGSLTFVRALYNIKGETAENEAPGTTRISWAGNDLAVMLTPKGNRVRQVNLDGTPELAATLKSQSNGLARTLVAPHIEGELQPVKEILQTAKAFGGVVIDEFMETAAPPPLRSQQAAAGPEASPGGGASSPAGGPGAPGSAGSPSAAGAPSGGATKGGVGAPTSTNGTPGGAGASGSAGAKGAAPTPTTGKAAALAAAGRPVADRTPLPAPTGPPAAGAAPGAASGAAAGAADGASAAPGTSPKSASAPAATAKGTPPSAAGKAAAGAAAKLAAGPKGAAPPPARPATGGAAAPGATKAGAASAAKAAPGKNNANATPGANGKTAAGTSAKAASGAAAKPQVRHVQGDHADATFRADGEIATVAMFDRVTYSDNEVTATGDRANMDMDSGHGEFFGAPVDLTSPRGRMRAPHVIYTTADQLVHAVEGVRAQIEQANDANLTGSALGEGKGPVLVVSQEAYWRRPQASFVFRGDVRAWRGDNLLLTPELTGERTPQGDQLAATRGVKTVWIPGESASASLSSPPPAATGGAKPAAAGPPGKATSSPTSAPAPAPTAQGAATAAGNAAAGNAAAGKPAAGTAPPAPASAAAGKPAAASSTTAAGAATTTIAPAAAKPATGPGGVPHSNGPITVLSTDMTYHDGSGILIYKGNVHVDQDGKTLTCHQLDVYLDVNHKAKQMTCTGDTHFDDPSTGRKIDGESAIYRVEARKVDVVGEVVTMHDREGNIVHGQRMRYNLDDGKVVVLGKDDGPKVGAAPGGTP